MPRGRRRKIEVPTDTQPQFELGDTAENIKKRRRERGEERRERERREMEDRERETVETEMIEVTEETEETEGKRDLGLIHIHNAHNPGRRRDR